MSPAKLPRRQREQWPEQQEIVILRIDGRPEPERRHRSRVAGAGEKTYVQTYSDPTSAAWREHAVWQLRTQIQRQAKGAPRPFCGPVKLYIAVYRERPTSLPAKVTRCTTKPDGDNYAKAVQDALVDAQVIYDDGQVDVLRVAKRFTDDEHFLGVDIAVVADPPEWLGR